MKTKTASTIRRTLIITVLLIFTIGMASAALAISAPAKPSVKSLAKSGYGAVTITTSKVSSAAGIQVKYSSNSKFKNAKTKTFSVKKLDKKKISGLSWDTVYYFKVRAFKKTSSGKKVFSKFSKKKSIRTKSYIIGYPTAYITHAREKKSNSSADVRIPYKAKVYVYGKITKRSKSAWVKLKYKGKVCYKYFKANTIYFKSTGLNYNNYKNLGVGTIRQKVITEAVNIYRYNKTTYKNTSSITPGSKDSSGRMRFDCSGFTSYVANKVMKYYIPNYDISNGITTQYNTSDLYTDASGKVKTKIVCRNTPDFNKLKPGDFLFFDDNGDADGVCDHVGIYIGNKEFIHSVYTVDGVCIMPLNTGRYKERFMCAKTFLPDAVPQPMNEEMIVNSPYTTGSKVYSDIKFNSPNGDKVYTGDIVTVKWRTPCRWRDDGVECCRIVYYKDNTQKKGYIQSSLLKGH
ncbi:MAG: NlpC/P60 family protein [Bacillota bacterium]|nr:NlpC/P60 family protein [Bacillota bacterium]